MLNVAGYRFMKKLVLLNVLLLFVGLDSLAHDKVKPPKVCITQDENEIYETIGVGNFQEETAIDRLKDFSVVELGDVLPETLANYRERNDRAYSLRCVERPGGKPAKLRRSPGANASSTFSMIGFDHARTEALVYHYSQAVGNYCRGDFILLRKKSEGWEVVKRVMTVIC